MKISTSNLEPKISFNIKAYLTLAVAKCDKQDKTLLVMIMHIV